MAQSNSTSLRKAALKPESLKTIIQSLGYKKQETALEEYKMFMTRVKKGFATKEWYQECEAKRNPNLCLAVKDYLEANDREKKNTRKTKRLRSKKYRLKIANAKLLQRENYQQQVRRFSTFKRSTLIRFAKAALKENACPRNLSLTLAYELEDHLDIKGTWEYVEKLYSHGISCLKNSDPWNEYILLRFALFNIAKKKHKKAIGLLEKALQSESLREDYRSYYWLWKMHKQIGQPKKAAHYAQTIINKFPRSWYAINVFHAQGKDPFSYFRQKNSVLDQYETRHKLVNLHGYWVKFGMLAAEDPYTLRRYADKFIRRLPSDIEQGYALHMARLFNSAKQHRFQIFLLTKIFKRNTDFLNEEVLKLLHPTSFLNEFNQYSNVIDSAILLGLARQESSFDPKAESTAKAKGLLQIISSTARRVDRKRAKHLFIPANNIKIGSKYLTQLLDRFDSNFEKALASYNAGPSRLSGWQKDYGWVNNLEVFLDLIPYRETRDYVPSILRNAFWYHNLYQDKVNAGKKKSFKTAELLKPLVSSINIRTPSNDKK